MDDVSPQHQEAGAALERRADLEIARANAAEEIGPDWRSVICGMVGGALCAAVGLLVYVLFSPRPEDTEPDRWSAFMLIRCSVAISVTLVAAWPFFDCARAVSGFWLVERARHVYIEITRYKNGDPPTVARVDRRFARQRKKAAREARRAVSPLPAWIERWAVARVARDPGSDRGLLRWYAGRVVATMEWYGGRVATPAEGQRGGNAVPARDHLGASEPPVSQNENQRYPQRQSPAPQSGLNIPRPSNAPRGGGWFSRRASRPSQRSSSPRRPVSGGVIRHGWRLAGALSDLLAGIAGLFAGPFILSDKVAHGSQDDAGTWGIVGIVLLVAGLYFVVRGFRRTRMWWTRTE